MGNCKSMCADSSTEISAPLDQDALEAPRKAVEPKLTVYIVGARGLRDADWMTGSTSDCYAVMSIDGEELHRTEVISDTLEPVWNEEVPVFKWEEGQPIEFNLLDKDVLSSDTLGKVVLPSSEFAEKGYNGEALVENAGRGYQAYLRLKIRLAGMELPPDPPGELDIVCPKGSFKSWGLDLDTQDQVMLYVTEVKPGPFAKLNQSSKPEDQLKKGDFIAAVNGIRGSPAALLNEFKLLKEVKIEVKRSFQVVIPFSRTDAKKTPLGLQFPKKPAGEHLVILQVDEEGAAETHNASQSEEELKLLAGDRIVSVGGVKGKATGLLEKISKETGKFEVSVIRHF